MPQVISWQGNASQSKQGRLKTRSTDRPKPNRRLGRAQFAHRIIGLWPKHAVRCIEIDA
jgi:hypothetical protein